MGIPTAYIAGAVCSALGALAVCKGLDKLRGKGDHVVLMMALLAVYDFMTDCIFVGMDLQGELGNPAHSDATKALLKRCQIVGVVSLVLSFLSNLVNLGRIMLAEMRRNPAFRAWYFTKKGPSTVVLCLSTTSLEVVRVLGCRVLSLFNAPMSETCELEVQATGISSNFLEDLPQLVVVVLVNTRIGWSTASKLSLVTTIITLMFSFSNRVSSALLYVTSKEVDNDSEEVELTSAQIQNDDERNFDEQETPMAMIYDANNNNGNSEARPDANRSQTLYTSNPLARDVVV